MTPLALQATSLLGLLLSLLLGLVPGSCGPRAPELIGSAPAPGAADVLRTRWIDLEFARPVPPGVRFHLRCDGEEADRGLRVHRLAPSRLVLDPADELPGGASCVLSWRARPGRAELPFQVAAAGAPLQVVHDRTDPSLTGPYPDDFFLTEDPATTTGLRHGYPAPAGPAGRRGLFEALLAEANQLDGFSPIAHFVVEVSDPLDPATLPATPAESLDPLASVALLDLAPGPGFGERVPFRLEVRNGDATSTGSVSHTLILIPSVPLEPQGRYGLVVTRRAAADPGRPLDPSPFFRAALAEPRPGEPPETARTRALAEDVLAAARAATPPIAREDVAFAARISVRSTASIQDDVQVMKRQILAAPPPAVQVDAADPDAVVPDPDPDVAALVRGTWTAPEWREGAALARDAEGLPVQVGSKPVCLRLALPEAAHDGPVPVVIYQHGNPGEAETEVIRNARSFLARAGYAVVGFTDVLNREVAPPASPGPACIGFESGAASDESRITAQVFSIFGTLLTEQRIPDHWSQTLGEQLAFVRAMESLAELDVLPLGAPDGVPEIDPSRLLYMGISEGGNNGQAFAAYAPEVRAAALMVGGARLMEVLIHQQAETFLETLPFLISGLSPADVWVAGALFQADFDRQDKHNHGRFVYRDPAEVPLECADLASCLGEGWCDRPGVCTRRKPSVLLVEGLDDGLVPNHATESAAWQMGPIPHLAPVQRAVPFLDVAEGPLAGNVDAETTAAFYQFVPAGVADAPMTPGCASPPLTPRSSQEGHYCAQAAVESRAQRLVFFATALDPERDAPTLADPLPDYPAGTPLFPLPDPLP